MMQEAQSRTLIPRMIRAAKLDTSVYEEIAGDRSATYQAISVVFISSLAFGTGNILRTGVVGLVGTILFGFLGWIVWAYVIYFLGTTLLREPQTQPDLGRVTRTTAFATSPLCITILGIIPIDILSFIIVLLAMLWTLVAVVIATQQAFGYTSMIRAVSATMLGFVANLLLLEIVFALS